MLSFNVVRTSFALRYRSFFVWRESRGSESLSTGSTNEVIEDMALKKSEIYSTLIKCANKLRSNSGIGAESFKNYVLIILFLKYISDRVKSGERTMLIIPKGCSFDDIIALKGKKIIGEEINKIIAKIAEVNELQDVINLTDHDFCDKKLGNPDDSSKLISELVAAFQDGGLDFSQNRAADDDLIGDAYEYLMRNFASQAGKDKGQFYTPTEVSRLMALLIGIDQDERPNVSAYDPTCGSGSLLLRVRAASKHNVSLDGQDIDPANIELSYLNMLIHGCETPDIRVGDTLNRPQHTKQTANGSPELCQYDYVVSNPKFSLHNWMSEAKENDIYGRWNKTIGVPPQQYGDFAFLLHCVRSLKHDGKCAIILPNGVLTRGGEEQRLRKWLVDEQHILSGIIAFPANAFFGTSIAGNVLILDKRRVDDGVFFIDASDLGYKDADSKIRLREQDIKRIIDVWRARKDVPHFAHLATYERIKQDGESGEGQYQIERNDFALNLSLYVTPVDKEVHQNIEAHLHGGIPVADIDRLEYYWDICPKLRHALFVPLRDGFVRLKVDKSAISSTINANSDFRHQAQVFSDTLHQWCSAMLPKMRAVGIDNDPKSLIAEWGQMLLDMFLKCPSLVNAYDVYDQLLGYYTESLQDDLYMISRDGWKPVLILPTKRNAKLTDLVCDLLPVDLAIAHFLPELKAQLCEAESKLASIQERIESHLDENEDCFDDSLFYGKLNASNLKRKIERCKAHKLTEKERQIIKSMMPLLEKTNKENKARLDTMLKQHRHLFPAECAKITKKIVNTLLTNSDNWEFSTSEQLSAWTDYSDMLEEEAGCKNDIKDLSARIYASVVEVYKTLAPDTVRDIIVREKWLAAIEARIQIEMVNVTHSIAADVTELSKRYEFTLSQLNDSFAKKEADVLNHLKEMGFEL